MVTKGPRDNLSWKVKCIMICGFLEERSKANEYDTRLNRTLAQLVELSKF